MNLSPHSFRILLLLAVVTAFCMLPACGVVSRTAPAGAVGSGTGGSEGGAGSAAEPLDSRRSIDSVQEELFKAHEEWKGTPYVLGGSGRNGVDCSSFIQIVFNRHFGLAMPRNTREQIQEGRGVRQSGVRPGDLIFFRTSRTTLHVGIAVNRHEFLHASTSSGVMISSMNERYWSSRFLGVRRVL